MDNVNLAHLKILEKDFQNIMEDIHKEPKYVAFSNNFQELFN